MKPTAMNRSLIVFALSFGCSTLRPAVRTSAPMGVTRVVLFQNGLGYFERNGSTGSDVDLVARRDHLDDVLKSLTVVDRSGGRVASVRVMPVGGRSDVVTLRLGLSGPARHDLSISYMTEVSGWRPSYRVVLGENGSARLQGFAVIDNHTGEPWRGVALGLSTATPLSFRYALHAERVAHRPQFNSDGRLVQTPQPEGNSAAQTQMIQLGPPGQTANVFNNVQAAYNMAQAELPQDSNRAGRMVGEVPQIAPDAANTPAQGGSLEDAWASTSTRESAAGVTMDAPAHLDLDVDEGAMIPFVDQVTTGEEVLLYRPSSERAPSAARPYRAVLFHNPLNAPLLTGPVTVYRDGAFIGDGVTATVPTRAHAFVAHALDPDVHVQRGSSSLDDEVRVTAAHAGVLTLRLQGVRRSHVTLDAAEPWALRAFVFIAAVEGFRPRALPDGSIEAPGGYFIPVAAGQRHAEVTFDLVQARTTEVHIETDPTHPHIGPLLDYLNTSHANADTIRELQRIHDRSIALRDQRVTLDEDLTAQQRALVERRQALGALRDVPANGALRARIGQSVAEGVAAVDAITRRVVANNAEALTLREQWYALTRALVA